MKGQLTTFTATFSDDRALFLRSGDGVSTHRVRDGGEQNVLQQTPNDSVSFTPDGDMLLVSHCTYRFPIDLDPRPVQCEIPKLVRVSDGSIVREYPNARGLHPQLSPDGTWMVAGDNLVRLATGAAISLGAGSSLSLFLGARTIVAATDAGDLPVYCLK